MGNELTEIVELLEAGKHYEIIRACKRDSEGTWVLVIRKNPEVAK